MKADSYGEFAENMACLIKKTLCIVGLLSLVVRHENVSATTFFTSLIHQISVFFKEEFLVQDTIACVICCVVHQILMVGKYHHLLPVQDCVELFNGLDNT